MRSSSTETGQPMGDFKNGMIKSMRHLSTNYPTHIVDIPGNRVIEKSA